MTEDGKKILSYTYSEKENVLAFAGLYEFWPDPFPRMTQTGGR